MSNGNLARVNPARGNANESPVSSTGLESAPVDTAVAGKPKRRRAQLLLAILALGLSAGGWRVWSQRFIESTDDAQVDAELLGVAARSGGTVSAVYFKENQTVHRGQLLAELDPTPARAKLAQAEANLAAARAAAHAADVQVQLASRNAQTGLAAASASLRTSSLGAESTRSEIAQARAGVDNASARLKDAEQNLARSQRLYDQGAVADAERDQRVSARDVVQTELVRAQAALANMEISRDLAQSKIVEARAKLSQSDQVEALTREAQARAEQATAAVGTAEAAKALAELDLSYTKIYAPSEGVVSKKNISVGQTIAAGQSVVLLVPNTLWVTANFKETQLDKMRVGQAVAISVDAYPGRTLHGEIESFSGATGSRFALLPPDNASGNFTKVVQRVGVRVKVATPPADVALRPGMSVEVDVDTHARAPMSAHAATPGAPGA